MSPDIVIVRDGEEYRMLHGHLHLAAGLSMCDAVSVDVQGEGEVKIVKTRKGYLVGRDGQRWVQLLN